MVSKLRRLVEERDLVSLRQWLEENGKSLPGNLPVTGLAYGMSASNHFLVGDDSIALVDPGTEVAPGIFKRIDGCS